MDLRNNGKHVLAINVVICNCNTTMLVSYVSAIPVGRYVLAISVGRYVPQHL
jgi:hypothetical protein